jgi:hypothetical protein
MRRDRGYASLRRRHRRSSTISDRKEKSTMSELYTIKDERTVYCRVAMKANGGETKVDPRRSTSPGSRRGTTIVAVGAPPRSIQNARQRA